MTKTTPWLSVFVMATILLTSIMAVNPVAFADDDNKKDKTPNTFESECAKKLDKKKLNLDGLFCAAIIGIQEQLSTLSFTQTDPTKPAVEIQVDPISTEPALAVMDGDKKLFTVNHDGSIKIGANSVTINPDGTITGSPLNIPLGSSVEGDPIATASDIAGIMSLPSPSGISSTHVVQQFAENIGSRGEFSVTAVALCPSGEILTGGGVNLSGIGIILNSVPELDASGNLIGWNGTVGPNLIGQSLPNPPKHGAISETVYAICAST